MQAVEMGQNPQLNRELRVRLCRNCIDCKHQRDLYMRKFKKFERKLGEITTNQNANLLRDAEKEIQELKEILSQKIKLQEEKKMKLQNEITNSTLDPRLDMQEVATVSDTLQKGGTVTERSEWEHTSYQICRWTIQKPRGASKLCRQVFTVAELVTHISEKHSGNTCFWHECELYGLPFKDSEELLAHVRFHVYRCMVPGCNKGFSCGPDLKEHKCNHRMTTKMVAGRGVVVYPCSADGCERSFNSAGALACHHVVAHVKQGEQNKCTVTSRTRVFQITPYVTEDMKANPNGRPLRCEFPGCGQSFMHSDILVQHCLMHFQK